MLMFILTICIIFSGCVEENNVTQSNESVYRGAVNITPENLSSTTLSSEEENIPEIEVTSFSSIYTHSNSEKIDGYLFSWDNVPGNESQRFLSYLKNDLDISWVDNAQIVKTNNNETIRVFTSENSFELILENNKSTILTIIDSVPLYLSEIKKENGKICVYRLEEYKSVYNITEKYYAVYNLSITNNGSKNIDFKLNELNVRDGNHMFNTTIEPEGPYTYKNEILSDLGKETKIEDRTLFPGQTISGSVIFQVNSLYNESFLLMYKETPITSASFEKNIKALRTAERYNYSVASGIPPYNDYSLDSVDSFEPKLESYPHIFPNWVNRSVFEFFNKADSENMANSSIKYIPYTDIVYALKVIPERNITMLPVKTLFSQNNRLVVKQDPTFIVVDDTGEELINASWIDKIAILQNQTYELHSQENVNISQMNFSNATIVKISYQDIYGRPMDSRLSFIDQDVILDDKLNIVVARYCCRNFIS